MKVVLILIALGLLTGCAHSDPWTKRDTIMYGGTLTLLAADAYTTSKIQHDPLLYEAGFIAKHVLGRQPSTSDTLLYFGSLAVSSYFIGRALPAKWRPYWYGFRIIDHGYSVVNNCGDGLCK